MKSKILCLLLIICVLSLTACSSKTQDAEKGGVSVTEDETSQTPGAEEPMTYVAVTERITTLEDGLSAVSFTGDDGFETFLEAGGASSDADVLSFLTEHLLSGVDGLRFGITGGGCSTISVPASDGDGYFFGRNFDWNRCEALILVSYPENGYSSISTVNTDFIKQATHFSMSDEMLKTAALYAPLDGMNEMGFCISVNMIQDNATIEQNTDKPDITTTTAIRFLLNKAATVGEAVELLESYDMHASFGYMVHFAMADANGNAVDVEYINGEMSVIETPILTNFYLTEGEKYGVGTQQSHTRFNILKAKLDDMPSMSASDVKDTLSSVSKGNFGEFESTEWSAVFSQANLTATYYHRENYDISYSFRLAAAR